MSEPFIAEIRIFAGNFAIRGWAQCDGQLLPINQNTAVFSLMGTTFGGDGRTTFGLPNLRGRLPIHTGGSSGTGPGLSNYRWGQRGGAPTHTLTTGQLPAHRHPVAVSSDVGGATGTPTATTVLAKSEFNTYGSAVDLQSMGDAVGGGQSHNNEQPMLGVNYLIALQGTFPSRS